MKTTNKSCILVLKRSPEKELGENPQRRCSFGVTFNLLQMAKRIGPQCKAAEYEDLSGEKNLTLDRVIVDDRRSHRAYE